MGCRILKECNNLCKEKKNIFYLLLPLTSKLSPFLRISIVNHQPELPVTIARLNQPIPEINNIMIFLKHKPLIFEEWKCIANYLNQEMIFLPRSAKKGPRPFLLYKSSFQEPTNRSLANVKPNKIAKINKNFMIENK